MEILIKLFWAFLKIGTFSFGGGYAMLPFIQKEVVESNGWISMSEFTDIIGISQMTPGPVAINSATFEACTNCTDNICIYRFGKRSIYRFKKYNNNFDNRSYIII